MATTVVQPPGVYPPGWAQTIVNQLVVNDGHVVNGVAGVQFGTLRVKLEAQRRKAP